MGHQRSPCVRRALGHRHDRQRHAHAVLDVPAVRADRQGPHDDERRARARALVRWRRGGVGRCGGGLGADRIGLIGAVILPEVFTAVGIAAVIWAPLPLALGVLAPLGIALNGTSSVLYGTVAELVSAERRSRAYGLYYT